MNGHNPLGTAGGVMICPHAQVAFAEVQSSANAILDSLGRPDKYPTLMLVCNGDLQLKQQYQVGSKRCWN